MENEIDCDNVAPSVTEVDVNVQLIQETDVAKIAYDAYVKAAGGISLTTGAKLPPFEALSISIQEAWGAAADAVMDAVEVILRRKYPKSL